MMTFFSGYAPHGYCLLWDPTLVWTHFVSDVLIAASYFSIPVVLISFLRRRPDINFGGVAGLFALFILSCGITHLLGIWNLWHGDYGIEGVAKAITALASVPTAIVLWRLLPRALTLPPPTMLQDKNLELATALAQRDDALAQLRDEVHQRERAEAALVQSKKMEAIGQLTGGIAHDFNNLLQGIKGYVELIGMKPDKPEDVRAWSSSALEAVRRGAKLTGQLLTFSRQQRLQAEAIDVGTMLAGMNELLRNSVGPRIGVEVNVADDLGVVTSDRNQLELALLNLAINARDAMPDGGCLRLAAERRADMVSISVTDDGTGMSDEVAEHAFEPFFTTKEPGRGTGLGLSTVYGLAQQAGGSVCIDSKQGIGTTVVLSLPRSEPRIPSAAVPHLSLVPEPGELSPGRLLLVDDDDIVRSALASMLRALRYDVFEAASAAAALEVLERETFALLLLDFAMPGMNGAELARRVVERNPAQRLLFLTGYADSQALDAAVDGRARVLKKPISATALTAAVEELLSAPRTLPAARPASVRRSAR